jgi:hypothetical protein
MDAQSTASCWDAAFKQRASWRTGSRAGFAADLEAANFAREGVDGQDRREYVPRAFDRL